MPKKEKMREYRPEIMHEVVNMAQKVRSACQLNQVQARIFGHMIGDMLAHAEAEEEHSDFVSDLIEMLKKKKDHMKEQTDAKIKGN